MTDSFSRRRGNKFVQAVLRGDVDTVRYELAEGGVHSPNDAGFTPLTALLILGSLLPLEQMSTERQEELLNLFVAAGVDFDRADANGTLPIFAALYADFPVALRVFNTADTTKLNPVTKANLIMAAAGLGLESVIEFVGSSFDLNAKDAFGNTAFHHAVFAARQFPSRMEQVHPREIVSTLCELGADPSLENNEGKTPYDLAAELGRYDVALVVNHCVLPKEGFRKLKIKLNPEAEPSDFYVHDRDLVSDVKKAILFEDSRDFNLLFPRFHANPIMDDARTFSDYGIRNGDLLTITPKLRVGRGGTRSRHKPRRKPRTRPQRGTRRN